MKLYFAAFLTIGLFFQPLFAQHIPGDAGHNGASCCAGYAIARAFGKSWNSPDCPASTQPETKISPSDARFVEYPFAFPLQFNDILKFGNDQHYVFVPYGGSYAYGTSVHFVEQCGGTEKTTYNLYDVIVGTGSLVAWGEPTGIFRKAPLWSAIFENSFGGGKIELEGEEYNSGYRLDNLHWGKTVDANAIEEGQEYGGYTQRFQQWEGEQDNLLSTEQDADIPITRQSYGPTNAETFTAEFLNEYDVPLVNQFVGLPNSGTMKVNGVTETLPATFPVLQETSIDVEALNQTINGINYRFDKWEDGWTSRYKTISPTNENDWIAEFEGIPLIVTGAHNTAPAGSNVHLVWDIHPNPNIRYHIFRKVKGVSGTYQIANLSRTTTSFIDYDYIVTNGYTDKLISYDVRAYYTTENTYADNNWWSLFGSIAPKLAANNDSLNTIPLVFGIRNFPNPFNPTTTIEYVIPEPGAVRVRIVDISGRIVTTLVNRNQSAGRYFIMWDGTNEYGEKAVSGFYFLQLVGNGQTTIWKILLLK